MSITASGLFFLTWEKMFIDTAGQSMEAETHKMMMTTDTYTPNFDTHDFRADVTDEVTGTGYTAGGQAFTTTDWTLSSGVATYDFADNIWVAPTTITNAMCAIGYFNVGAAGTDQLLWLSDFVTAASSSGGSFTVATPASGAITLDYTP